MSKEQSKHVCLNCFSTNVKSIDEIKKGRDFYFKDRPLENAYEHGNLSEGGYYWSRNPYCCPHCGEGFEWKDWYEKMNIVENRTLVTMGMPYNPCPNCGYYIEICYRAFEINAFSPEMYESNGANDFNI